MRNTFRNSDKNLPFSHIGCVIMASGLARRFGSNKLMADFHGAPMIQRILDATDGIFSKRIVVTRHQAVADYCSSQKIPVLLHDFFDRSDVVRIGLKALGDVDACMFCPGDQPLLKRDTILALCFHAIHTPDAIWRTAFHETPGSPVLFPKWAFPELLTLPPGKGGGLIAKKYPEQIRYVSVRDEYELFDVDTPDDLKRLMER